MIEPGQQVVLSWEVANATSVTISPMVGAVDGPGKKRLPLNQTTTFHLNAASASGTATASVSAKAAALLGAPPPGTTGPVTSTESAALFDVYFDFDRSDIREDSRPLLVKDARQSEPS